MRRLHTAVEHCRESGQVTDVFHCDSRIAKQLGSAAGRDQFHSHTRELAGKIRQAGFVGDTENRALNALGHGDLGWELITPEQEFYQQEGYQGASILLVRLNLASRLSGLGVWHDQTR